jgi:hypothetical protein
VCVAGTRPPPGDAPIAAPDAYPFAGAGPFDVRAANGVLANDSDPGGATLTAVLDPPGTTRTAKGGTVYLAPDGSFTYVPPILGFTGDDAFTYRASNGTTSSDVTTVSLSVTP